MKTIIDLVNFLEKLESNYPIPYVDKIFEDVDDVYDYLLSWETEKGYVDCSFFKQKDDTYKVVIYSNGNKYFPENWLVVLKEKLAELYAN